MNTPGKLTMNVNRRDFLPLSLIELEVMQKRGGGTKESMIAKSKSITL